MSSFCLLNRDWKDYLGVLIRGSDQELVIAVPYISIDGVDFVTSNMPQCMKASGRPVHLTDLSPMPICQGSTDPSAIQSLVETLPVVEMFHLPKLHAKVYVSGTKQAIITSGNLTKGGLSINYEYGIGIDEPVAVADFRNEVLDYSSLGVPISRQNLLEYCKIATRVRDSFRDQMSKVAKGAREEFRKSIEEAEDELIRIRLIKGPLPTVFSAAILYFLKRNGPLETGQTHDFIEDAYPDLCDNTVDRVIDGEHHGKKWKHAVRTAQQHLKARALVEYVNRRWQLSSE
jgi:hypothetical protein